MALAIRQERHHAPKRGVASNTSAHQCGPLSNLVGSDVRNRPRLLHPRLQAFVAFGNCTRRCISVYGKRANLDSNAKIDCSSTALTINYVRTTEVTVLVSASGLRAIHATFAFDPQEV